MPQQPPSARRHYLWSAALARRAVREAQAAQPSGLMAVSRVILVHQATAASQAQPAVRRMLDEQNINEAAEAILNSLAFTTEVESLSKMLDETSVDFEFDRLVASLVQDAGRAAEQAATAVTPKVGFVRHLSPPSCSRCAVLAGRVYRYSEGFLRHPGCDCTMTPTSLTNPAFTPDPVEMLRRGQVTGLSKADQQAVRDGADLGQVVNVRSKRAGLTEAGQVLSRAGRPTPAAIYRNATSRDDAIEQLIAAGYVR